MKNFFTRERVRYLVLGFLAISFIASISIYSLQTKDVNELAFYKEDGVCIDFSQDWIDEDGNLVNLDELKFYDHEDRESYLFHKVIPDELLGEESLCFEVRHMGFIVYFDDRDYDGYEYGDTPDNLDFLVDIVDVSKAETENLKDSPDKTFDDIVTINFIDYRDKYGVDYIAYAGDGHGSGIGSRGAGTYLKTMQLYVTDAGDTVYLELFPVYSSSKINHIMIEPANSYIRYRILTALPRFIVCLIIIVTGVTVLIICLLMKGNMSVKIYEALASLIILVGTWSMTETHLFDYILGTSEYMHTVSYFLLMVMAYPIAVFSDTVMLKPHKKISDVIFWITVILILYCTIVNYWDIFDFHDTVYLSDALILVTGIFVIVRLIIDQKFRRDNDLHINTNWIDISLTIITILGFVDLFRYLNILSIKSIFDSSFFTRIGVLIFTIGMFINIFEEVVHRNRQADKAGTYMEMAFTDALTGIPNRGAFLLKESELSDRMKDSSKRKKDNNFQIVYVAFDLNGLKIVNDTLGHATGDDYIVAASGILMQSFSEYGYVYRVGGDEFASFIVCDNAVGICKECIQTMKDKIRDYNKNSNQEMQMHIAYGYSVWRPGDTRSISEIEKEGDEAMYEKKRQMKKEAAKNTTN